MKTQLRLPFAFGFLAASTLVYLSVRADIVTWTFTATPDQVYGSGSSFPGIEIGSFVTGTITVNTNNFVMISQNSVSARYYDPTGFIKYESNVT